MPIILVLFGLSLLQIPFIKNSPSFYLDTSAYPGPQRLLFNEKNVDQLTSEYTPSQLAMGLPDYASYFDVKFDANAPKYTDFYSAVDE